MIWKHESNKRFYLHRAGYYQAIQDARLNSGGFNLDMEGQIDHGGMGIGASMCLELCFKQLHNICASCNTRHGRSRSCPVVSDR